MKTLSVALAAHYASGSTTLARLWRVTRKDGLVFGFTDHDQPIVYDGVTYAAKSAFAPSAVATRSEPNVDNMELVGLLEDDGIEDDDIEAGLWDGAEVRLVEVNWADLTMGHNVLRQGVSGQLQRRGGRYVAELRGLIQALQNNVGRIVTPACSATLGDAHCGVALSDLQVAGTVVDVVSNREFTVTGLGASSSDGGNEFELGTLQFTSGLNVGIVVDIRSQSDDSSGDQVILLQLPAPYDVQVGDDFIATPGCDKSKATCIAKFNNLLNFRGFSFLPGQDASMEIGGQ